MKIPFNALLLAGGKSKRMGRDKCMLTVKGNPLWKHQWNLLQGLEPEEMFIAGPSKPEWAGYPVLADAKEDAGPLGGIVAALRISPRPFLMVLAVDMPEMEDWLLRRLLDCCSPECGVLPAHTDFLEPLAAIYPISILPLAEHCLESGEYGMQDFARRAFQEGMLELYTIPQQQEYCFFNLNSPEDFKERPLAP